MIRLDISKGNGKGDFTTAEKILINEKAQEIAKEENWQIGDFHNIDVSDVVGRTDNADIWVI